MNALRIFPSFRRLEKKLKQQAADRQNELNALILAQTDETKKLSHALHVTQLTLDTVLAMQSRLRNAQPARKITPFVLNSNLPDCSPAGYDQMMHEMAGNPGNTYITYSILKTVGFSTALHPKQHVKNIWEDPLPDVDYVNSTYTHCFFTLQDQFQERLPDYIPAAQVLKIIEFIKALRVPLVAYSVGTNFAPNDTTRTICSELSALMQAISEKCLLIGVRGEITRESLAKSGVHNTMVIGCPTYFENGFGRLLHKKPLTPASSILGTGLFSTHAPNPVHFLAQSETLAMKLSCEGTLAAGDIAGFKSAADCYPGYGHTFLNALKHNRVRAFHDINEWKRYITEADIRVAIGTRLHGSILAINCGVPALCTAGDTRAQETCAYLGIPHRPGVCGLDLNPSDVLNAMDLDALNHRYQETYARYLIWLDTNGL
jgi:hypothetical protein